VKRAFAMLLPLAALALLCVFWVGSAAAVPETPWADDEEDTTAVSGPIAYKDFNSIGNSITECPQAGLRDEQPKPLRQLARDRVEQMSDEGSNVRVNQDYSCFPQDETALDINPRDKGNIVGGANDYRLGWGTSGFYASTDKGEHWYDGITPFPSLPSGDNLDGGGDPAIVYDRQGIVYYAQINFNRTDATSGVWVNRSTNGGFTWSRPCAAIDATPTDATDDQAVCGGPGDPRQPGDGTVAYCDDLTTSGGCQVSYDKEWITAGPRPAGVEPTCFTPIQHTAQACNSDQVGVDRLYVTYSLFTATESAAIMFSYSDDRGHSWSPSKYIAGSAAFCAPSWSPSGRCQDSQGSQPTVNPVTGQLWVGFLNGDTEDEDQYLVVTSTDGGNTFSAPSRVDTIYDVNEPRSNNGRADCSARGQSPGRAVLTNTCFRVDPIMHSIVADKRGGPFANDLYLVVYDNRNGTIRDSNNDVFFYRSTDGGTTWIGPTRVNNDRSEAPTAANANAATNSRQGARDCGRNDGTTSGTQAGCQERNFGADQWFPWVTIDKRGNLSVTFHDRRLDTSSPVGVGAWPSSKTEQGNYLVWFWGAKCRVTDTATVSQRTMGGSIPAGARQCVAPEATINPGLFGATPSGNVNAPPGAVPGQNENPATLPFRNFQVSETPSNWDYTFRAGLFAGDYTGNVTGPINPLQKAHGRDRGQAFGLWTDARNGRGSGDPTSFQPGRNPICEESDVFFDSLQAAGEDGDGRGNGDLAPWLVTPCPLASQDKTRRVRGAAERRPPVFLG
jgi:hypothetical protein